ncbi:hypothetical protein [Deinococcus sp. QL22]|uniref:DUF7352 domain-containing protein n=1 Tax=Deinococcus sp. QL22 TaxID=2939437 RepID=UPI0020176E63|nr:hypothetical protein [Deinococcus sp. QL22]UQN06780.1 hypothetical protein M1R55_02330 [Deinococcus sp. QL22]
MYKIYKYPLDITDEQAFWLPEGAELLSVQFQGGQLCLWALVDPELAHTQCARITVIGTGNPISEPREQLGQFIGTAQGPRGFVWHVFGLIGSTTVR